MREAEAPRSKTLAFFSGRVQLVLLQKKYAAGLVWCYFAGVELNSSVNARLEDACARKAWCLVAFGCSPGPGEFSLWWMNGSDSLNARELL